MSDLITRSKVISVLEQLEEHSLTGKMYISNAIYLLNNQPTAYDIDDFIAKCESAKFVDDDETVLSDIHQGVNSGLSMAIHFAKELKKGE